MKDKIEPIVEDIKKAERDRIFAELDKVWIPQALNEYQLEIYNKLKEGK